MVFVIAGLIGAMVMTLGMKWAEREENMSTKRKIETIQIALENFSRANNRLPCPADLSLTSDHAQYGVEANGLGGCNDGAVPDAIIAPSYTVYGAVPVATLGMSESMTKDQWGNMILYYVDKRMTDDMAFALFPPANTTVGDIIVEDESGNPRTSQAIYALLSFGANELGAIREGGTNDTEAPAPDHALEQRNTNRDGSGNSLEPMDADSAQARAGILQGWRL